MVNVSRQLQSEADRGLFMDIHSPEEYSNYTNLVSPSKKSAISVKPDGDIINFISTAKGEGKELMFSAIEHGGKKMDNY